MTEKYRPVSTEGDWKAFARMLNLQLVRILNSPEADLSNLVTEAKLAKAIAGISLPTEGIRELYVGDPPNSPVYPYLRFELDGSGQVSAIYLGTE